MTRPWMHHSVEKAFEGIARAGFKYTAYVGKHAGSESVTLDTPTERLKELRRQSEAAGLKAVTCWAGDPLKYGQAGLKRYLEMAGELGLEFLILSSPYAKERNNPELSVEEEFISIVTPLLDLADSLGVGMHVKPHMGEMGTGAGLAKLARTIGHPRFGVSYDPGNIQFYEGLRADEDVKDVAGEVLSICVKDHKGAQRENNFPAPGDGDVTWEPIWQALSGADFTGYALIERLGPSEEDGTVEHVADQIRQRMAAWVKAAGGTVAG